MGPAHPPVADLPPVAAPSTSSSNPTASAETWATVAARKAQPGSRQKAPSQPAAKKPAAKKAPKRRLPKVPKTAAVAVTVVEGAATTYTEVMRAARTRIQLPDLGVETVEMKKAVTGGVLMNVSGPDGDAKADRLAARLREVLTDFDVRIARPMKMGELRVSGLDDAATPAEVASAVAEASGCSAENVKVGEIRRTPTSLGTVHVRCPLAAVHKLAANSRIRVGWGSAKVEVLEARPLYCFRCLEKGHVGQLCPNGVDRSDRCFACGERGHRANKCTVKSLRCPLCSDMGRPSAHRLGAKACCQTGGRGKGKKPSSSAPVRATAEAPASAPGSAPQEAMEVSHSRV